jgi:hypothetical protein
MADNLKTEVESSCKMLVTNYHSTQHHIPKKYSHKSGNAANVNILQQETESYIFGLQIACTLLQVHDHF